MRRMFSDRDLLCVKSFDVRGFGETGYYFRMIPEMVGQGAKQFVDLGCAFLLSAGIGLEREIRHKSAGLRTYALAGTSAALFLLISKYGFMDVLANDRVVLDPSRVAAQIVTGIGFIGAGLIFVRGDRVNGLTTAATVWLVTGVGMACGAGLLLLALAATSVYYVVALAFPLIERLLPRSPDPPEKTQKSEHD
jgi:putative Mg2+ transporter-C (MgtC) family protein